MSTPLDQDLKEIDIVTCPTFYQFRAGYDRLIQIFKDLQIEGRTWIYPNGRIRHRWILSPGISPEIMKEIRSIHISLLPLEFHMTLSTDTEINIYKYLITDYLMTKWKYDYDIFISIINDNVVLTPYIRGPDDLYDLKVYLNSDEISEIQSKIKWKDSLSDKIPLGSDPLIEYLLKDLPEKENLDIYSDVYLLPIPIDQTNIQDIRNEYLDDIISFRSQGYFSIKLNIDTRDIVYDLFKLFEVPIVHETENYIFGKSENYVKEIINNITRIKSDKIPIIEISGPWCLYLKLDTSTIAKIYFVLYSLLREYSLIKPYLNEVHVFDSGHMTLPMINMNQITTIREKVSQSMDTLDNLYSIVVKDNFEGVLYRWILHSIDPESLSMIIPHSKDLHVVSSINPNKVPSVSEFESKIKKAPDSLRSMMLDYLNNECGMKSDPVSMMSFDEMNLQDLLSVVRPEQKSDYCYTLHTLSSLQRRVSPITSIPFPERILQIINDPTLSIRGFLPLGKMLGLIQIEDLDIPKIKPVEGDLIIVDTPSDDSNTETTSILIQLGDRKVIDFIELDTVLSDDDFQLLNNLWNSGYFLNIWGRICNEYLKTLNGSFLRFDPLLFLGKGSPGQVAEAINRIRNTASNY